MNQQLFSDFSLTGGILFTMWVVAAAIAILLLVLAFFRFRQSTDVRPSTGIPSKRPQTGMEISTGIGVPPEEIDPDKAGKVHRQAGVTLPAVPPPRQDTDDSSLASVKLRKIDLPKEVELAWEAGGLIEFQTGAWAVAKDPSEYSDQDPESKPARGPARKKPSGEVVEESYSLPQRYGIDRLVLIARDPDWVYAYWEVTHERYRQMYERHLRDWGLSRPVLRIYDVTPGRGRQKEMDVFISDHADNWYINISKPRHTLMAELGRLFPDNTFLRLVASNVVTLPADRFSDKISADWPPVGWPDRYHGFQAQIGTSSPGAWGNEADG